MIKPKYYQGKNGDLIDHWYDRYGETADIIMVANVEKYLERFKEKNGLEDLEKAETYLARLVEKVQARQTFNVKDLIEEMEGKQNGRK